LDLETTTAALEAMAKGGVVGSEAGIKLRNILLSLAASGRDELNPAITPLPKILATLSDELGLMTDPLHAATKAVDLFDKRNVGAALALIGQRDELERLDGKLLDHGNAMRQAITNTDNLTGSWAKLKVAFEAAQINLFSFGKASDTALKGLTEFFRDIGQSGLVSLLGFETAGATLRKTNEEQEHAKTERELHKADIEDLIELNNELFGTQEKVTKGSILEPKEVERRRQLLALTKENKDSVILESRSIEELKTRYKELIEELPIDETAAQNRAALLDAIQDRIKELKGQGKEIEVFANGSLAFLNQQIELLNKKLQVTTDETVLKQTTDQIVELENAVESIQKKLDRAKNLAGLNAPKKSTGLLGVPSTIDFGKPLGDLLTGTGQAEGLGLPSEKTQQDQRLKDEKEHQAQQTKIIEDAEKERQRIKEESLRIQFELERDQTAAISELIGGLGDTLFDLFAGNQEQQHEALKSLLQDLIRFVEIQIDAQILAANARAALSGPLAPAALLQNALTIGVIHLGFAALKAVVASFETGLEAGQVGYSGKEITGGKRYTRPGSSDNVLIHAKTGERVINESQQRTIERVYGKDFWKHVATGRLQRASAINNIITNNSSSNGMVRMNDSDIIRFAETVADEVGNAVESRNTGNRKRERVNLVKVRQ
jgi:hypothetical protein